MASVAPDAAVAPAVAVTPAALTASAPVDVPPETGAAAEPSVAPADSSIEPVPVKPETQSAPDEPPEDLVEPAQASEPVKETQQSEPAQAPEPVKETQLSEPTQAPEPVKETQQPELLQAAEPVKTQHSEPSQAPEPAKEEVEEEEEPQNPLTKKFTEAEWKALKEFRPQLPDIIKDAYSDKPDPKPQVVNLWGVTLDPAKKDARASVVLVKFLRARNLNPSEAKSMLISTLRWRDEFKVEEACKSEYPEDIFGQLGHIYGKDSEGRPVVYNLYGANKDLKAVFGDVPRFIRWRVAFMEKSITYLDFENVDQMIQVHDYEGVSFTSRDQNSKNAASEASSIFSDHYPELLHKKFFVNVPSFLTWIFWLFKPLVSANTLAKMSVVGSGPATIGKAILPYVDKNELPKRYGGAVDGF